LPGSKVTWENQPRHARETANLTYLDGSLVFVVATTGMAVSVTVAVVAMVVDGLWLGEGDVPAGFVFLGHF
jgi:hypothetical protein